MYRAVLLILAISSKVIAQSGTGNPLSCLTCVHNEISYGTVDEIDDPACVSGSTQATSRESVHSYRVEIGRSDSAASEEEYMAEVQDMARKVLSRNAERQPIIPITTTLEPEPSTPEETTPDPRSYYCAIFGVTRKNDSKAVVIRTKYYTLKKLTLECKTVDQIASTRTYCLCATDDCNSQSYNSVVAASVKLRNDCVFTTTMVLFSVFVLPRSAQYV